MEKIPLIFLPGLLSNDRVFYHQIQHLNDIAGIQVVCLTDVNTPTAMVEKILRAAPKYFALVGHSIGGWVSLKVMEMAPERVTKLCILNTSARGIDQAELKSRQILLERAAKGEFPSIVLEIIDRFVFNHSVKPAVLEMFLQVGVSGLINQTQAMMLREDLRNILPTIRCPTLVVHAEQDQRFTLNDLTEISNGIPNSILKIVPQCGHMSPMEQPEIMTYLIKDWLSKT